MPAATIKTIWPDVMALSNAAAHIIVTESNKAIAQKGYCTIALSGGNTPRVLYELLAAPPFSKNINWKKCFFYFGDERFVPRTSEESNYKMAMNSLLSKVPVPKKNIFGILTENIDPALAASVYEAEIKQHVSKSNPFDIILLGIGEEGHTASIFPDSSLLKETKKWVSNIFVKEKNMERITFTLPFINMASNIIFLVSGNGKTAILKKIFSLKWRTLPAAMVQPKENLFWLLDEAAAGRT